MATKRQLATRLLRKLGVLGAGETASADDIQLAEEKITSVHDFLATTGRAKWALSNVPDLAAEGYAIMGGVLAGPDFGVPPVSGAWAAGLQMIAVYTALGRSSDPVDAEYF